MKYIHKKVMNDLKAVKYLVFPKYQWKQENAHLEV